MRDDRVFFLTVASDRRDGGRTSLLSMVSELHRRGVEVLEARFAQRPGDGQWFAATIRASARQADLVLRSLDNVVGVTGTTMIEVSEACEAVLRSPACR